MRRLYATGVSHRSPVIDEHLPTKRACREMAAGLTSRPARRQSGPGRHGTYRSLVAARFIDAERRGTPVLVVQAGPMSRPILTQLGFETILEITFLLDEWETAPA